MDNIKNQERYKHLTILHSNDLHGDFLAENVDEKLVGGVAMLSGYINKVRKESKNTLYMIAGDMFRGSLIDSEFQGISTIEIMNALGPDIVSLGNHELDYGISHLLFLEKCCKFPIINANVYIKTLETRLFKSHKILEIDGMKILVIGILTEEIMARAKKDTLLGTFINLEDAVKEVGVICETYKDTDIDMTVLLTHIGYENDIELAKKLNPEWGIDIIVGGHSHTFLEKPAEVNNILIVQAGIGTDQIGRFEIEVDTQNNCVSSYTWKSIPINEQNCERNHDLENLILNYKQITDAKYGAILTTLTSKATHPSRYEETSVGNLFADILLDNFNLDLVMLGSGSLRKPYLDSIVTKGDLLDMYSYDEKLLQLSFTGAELKCGFEHVLSLAPDSGDGHSEYYQISKDFCFEYSKELGKLTKATYLNKSIDDDALFNVGMEGYHADNLMAFFKADLNIVSNRAPLKTVTSNIRLVVEEYMKSHTHLTPKLEGRTKRY